ncbi:MAG TPA: hypothetical protein VFT70_16705 [Nocardioides sp.]|nr:hypothetical protein [Nocardioides sp.]
MTAPIPEEQDQPATPVSTPPGEHASELPDEATGADRAAQEENAGTALDEPSDDTGGDR